MMADDEIRSRKHRMRAASVFCCMATLIGAGVATTGCASDGNEPTKDTVRFQLDFGNGVTLTTVNYMMTGPNSFKQSGTLTVGSDPTATATFSNLPAGNGYDIKVTGSASDNSDTCKGEVMFNVTAMMMSVIQIPLTCTGIAMVSADYNVCPVIDSLSAIPSEVYVGDTIQVTAQAHDSDNGPSPLGATWSTTGGSLSNLSLTGATFTCTTAGTFSVGYTVSDGSTSSRCADTSTLTLTCSTPPSAELTRRSPAHRRAV